MRVSPNSWREFLASLVEFSNAGLRLILLGRRLNIEDVWAELGDFGTQTEVLEISHFEPAQQLKYIDTKALAGNEEPPEYRRARDAVLACLRQAPSEGVLDDIFIGYPPVLDAVARLVDRKANLFSVAESFSDRKWDEQRTAVLGRILQELLARDQRKASPLAADLNLAPSTIYTSEEQLDWLAYERLGAEHPVLPGWAEPDKDAYIKRIREFLRDHTFTSGNQWASPVFAAYVAARRLEASDATRLAEIGNQTGLLFDFLSTQRSAPVEVTEPQFVAIQASVVAGESAGTESSIAISAEPAKDAILEASAHVSVTSALNQARTHSLEAQILLESQDTLTLHSPIASTTVKFPESVVLKGDIEGHLRVGPDVHVKAGTLKLFAHTMEVLHSTEAVKENDEDDRAGVDFIATEFFPENTLLAKPQGTRLSISVPDTHVLAYPWIDARETLAEGGSVDHRARRFLDKLMSIARKHGHKGERAVFIKKLEGRQNLRTEEFASAVKVLLEKGVLRQDGDLLFVTAVWDKHRYDGKLRQGMPAYVAETWDPVVAAIASAVG